MLHAECRAKGVTIRGQNTIKNVESLPIHRPASPRYRLETSDGLKSCCNLIVATGGLSIPKIGASDFGYRLARSFGLRVTALRPGLGPLVLGDEDKAFCTALSGVALPVLSTIGKQSLEDALLFTHRGVVVRRFCKFHPIGNRGRSCVSTCSPGRMSARCSPIGTWAGKKYLSCCRSFCPTAWQRR